MLRNFQLAAIVKQGRDISLLRIPLHRDLQDSLAESWGEQLDEFLENVEEIEFDAGYNPEPNELFALEDYEAPGWLAGEDSQSVPNLDSIATDDELIDSIKGLVALARDDNGNEVMVFQNFTRSRVIKPGLFLFLRNNTFITSERPGLTLDNKLSAVFWPGERKLLFHNFRAVNTYLPLADFYEEASEAQIREVLGHDLFEAEDADALAQSANQWFRKRFAMLQDSDLLENYTARQIRDHANGYEVDVQLRNGKIVFPADRKDAKKLLQFLNEEIFKGAITEQLYETNSKREAD